MAPGVIQSWKMWRTIVLLAIPLSSVAITDMASAQQGSLTVSPESGPIGTVVILEGLGCGNLGQNPTILFGGTGVPSQGTAGSSRVPGISADASGAFRVSYTIPAEIGSQQQWQGGPVVAGRYNFTSL